MKSLIRLISVVIILATIHISEISVYQLIVILIGSVTYKFIKDNLDTAKEEREEDEY